MIALSSFAMGAAAAGGNATIYLGANNVHGEVPSPAVVLLGVAPTLPGCEALCIRTRHACGVEVTWHPPLRWRARWCAPTC